MSLTGKETMRHFFNRLLGKAVWLELLLLLLALGSVYSLSLALAAPELLAGLGGRYLRGDLGRNTLVLELMQEAGWRFALLASAGWLSLALSRLALPLSATLALWLAGQFALTDALAGVWSIWSWSALALLLTLPLLSRFLPLRSLRYTVRPWLFPALVLFWGLGLLLWLDVGARGYESMRYLGLKHWDALRVAMACFNVSAVLCPVLFSSLARAWARVDGATGSARLFRSLPYVAYVVLTLLIIAVFRRKMPWVSSELIRIPLFCLQGWLIYRWFDGGLAQPANHKLKLSALVLLCAVFGLLGTWDLGPLMVVGQMSVLIAVCLLWQNQVRSPKTAWLLAAAVLLVWLMSLWALELAAPMIGGHVAQRLTAIVTPFSGELNYLSQLRWFADATPTLGFGLGDVPWCGTLGDLEAAKCNGVPKELHSDYVITALLGAWGKSAAVLISLAVLAFCFALLPNHLHQLGGARLRCAIGTVFVLTTAAQLSVTVLGNLGHIALTGVTYPFIGFGTAALCTTALFVGLLCHFPSTTQS
jgi:cell division protein FtsW (lipid II flippase)